MKDLMDNVKLKKLWLGIDPGERWTGLAVLGEYAVTSPGKTRSFHADTIVFDGDGRGRYAVLEHLRSWFTLVEKPIVIAEDFRIRPSRHQSFSDGMTLRLLGAIEYMVLRFHGEQFHLQAPGDPDVELPLLKMSVFFNNWAQMWPKPGDKAWHHGRSAWRALSRYLLWKDLPTMRKLAVEREHFTRANRLLSPVSYDMETPFIAQPIRWSR